ncbi:MAG: prolipoprotein diacylglyceryl transferase [Candidatus Margulisiibacteriota bacterium]|nr:MAG: prolipoprotein diacylglyceryl transferase [Candidatus Margulisbacteria bacterium GWF2_38_17]PZM77236.1 MAG: prolipoprotein diacylglyceryl transferase [Candidatus Margulisiibacteriota bacterium]HCY35573.1 prolipoprotein diacylglyceryl transferase [Candidatus Margulisiibacteriota bacterium]
MNPVFLQIGPIVIRYYGLMYLISFLFAIYIANLEIKRRGLGWNFEKYIDLMMYSFLLSILGARIYYVIFTWSYYSKNLADIVAIWKGGLAIHGGIVGAIIGILVFSRMFKFNLWTVGDISVLGLSLGQVFGRFGNFMNGDAHGVPTSLPWGVIFPSDTPAGMQFPDTPIHPVMLYEMVLDFVIFLMLWRLRKRPFKPGFLSMLYFILYSIIRFFVCFFRADSLMLGPLKVAQVISILTIVVAGYIMYSRKLWETESL